MSCCDEVDFQNAKVTVSLSYVSLKLCTVFLMKILQKVRGMVLFSSLCMKLTVVEFASLVDHAKNIVRRDIPFRCS